MRFKFVFNFLKKIGEVCVFSVDDGVVLDKMNTYELLGIMIIILSLYIFLAHQESDDKQKCLLV